MPQTFILTFTSVDAYEKGRQEIEAGGGEIKQDYGPIIKGFAASMPDALVVEFTRQSGLVGSGISSFEPDREVKIQEQ